MHTERLERRDVGEVWHLGRQVRVSETVSRKEGDVSARGRLADCDGRRRESPGLKAVQKSASAEISAHVQLTVSGLTVATFSMPSSL